MKTPSYGSPVIIDVAINGTRTREMNPNLPVSMDEIAAEAVACLDAGASIIHAHNSSFTLTGREAADEYVKIWTKVLKIRPDTLWYPTLAYDPNPNNTGVEHMEILAKEMDLKIGCVDPGAVNLGTHLVDDVPSGFFYRTSLNRTRRQFSLLGQLGLGIAIGIYEPGYLRTAMAYFRAKKIPRGSSLNLYFFGDYGLASTEPANACGFPPEAQYLDVYLSLMKEWNLPWFVSVWGAGEIDSTALLKRTLELGGHIQVGLEAHYHPTRKPTNIDLLNEVKLLADAAGRPVATPRQARKILGID